MFVTTDREKYIDIVIKSVLSNLNNTEYVFVFNKYKELLEYIYLKLLINDSDSDKFFEQLSRNKNREIIAILYLFFPYINDANDYEKFKLIKKLSDITLKKTNDTYEICNFQYSRGYQEKDTFKEYSFSTDDIRINFELLKNTIERLRTKLYVNWVNIVPILLEKYKESKIYKNTIEYYINDNNNNEAKEKGLPFGEFYDTIVNDLYLNTLDFKWLLFEKSINGKMIMYLDILNDIYPVYNILNNKEDSKWLLLDQNNKTLFSKNMDVYFSKVEKGESYNGYPNELLKDFFVYMMNFFDIKYNFLSDIKDYTKVNKNDTDEDEKDEDANEEYDDLQKNLELYFKNFKIIDKLYLYDFIRSQILKLNNSWFGYKIFRNNKIIKLYEYNNKNYNLNKFSIKKDKIYVTYKNIYNFSKSLYLLNHNENDDKKINQLLILSIPLYYDCLNIVDKENIKKIINLISNFNKIDNIDPESDDIKYIITRFSIGNNLKKMYSEDNYIVDDIRDINISLIANILVSILDIVFECLCKRGLLSEYIIRKNEFEKYNLNQNKNEIIKESNEKLFEDHLKKYDDAFYYITDDRYKNLKKITNDRNKRDETYFKTLTKRNTWYNVYAMDWVSQINFYNHYTNQRITMLTGGTGVGKSTQTPKLLLYGLKAFDKRFKGKVICTQPRISPTVGNAERISYELGVPIKNYSNFYKKDVKTTYGYIQYQYEGGTHIDDDQEFFLKIVTDGTLLSQIKNSPILKQTKNDSRTEFDIDNKKIYSIKNLYDIVIVDESHEHNANMDIILTMIRTSIFLNNQLKLYIISATMEADDPIYRKYYRYINDNLLYPIRDIYNPYITPSGGYDELLDRCVIDRRIHISPPRETTQYVIKEIYNTSELEEKESYQLAIKYALDICTNNSAINNDILLFCTTTNNIIKLVDELNIVLPPDTIAIPFYKNLPEDSKTMIGSKLNQLKEKFKFEKKYIHDVLNNRITAESINSNYKYDRILIVSTNIAEASITIDSLKFVIDTGFNLDVSYNYDTDTNNIEVIKISEASRLQRKGRVGRVGDGTVYYTYPKNGRLNGIPSYGICKTNFTNTFLDLMEEYHSFDLYSKIIYPYTTSFTGEGNKDDIIIILNKNIKEEIKKYETTKIIKIKFELFKKMIIHQYYTTSILSNKLSTSDKLYNINLITEDSYNFLVPIGNSGINTNNLVDSELNYFLIHPFENKYGQYRNKSTRLLDYKFLSKKIDIRKNIKFDLINKLETNLYVYEINDQICKVKMVEVLNKLKQKMKDKLLELNLFYPIIIGNKLGIFDNLLFIVYFLINTDFNLLGIVDNLQLFNSIFLNKESDLLIINNIFNLFKATYKHLLYNNDINIDQIIIKKYDAFKKDYYNYKNKYFNLIEHKNYNDLIDIIIKNDDIEKIYERFSEKLIPDKIPDYIISGVNNWCKNYGINSDKFLKILFEYNKQYICFKFMMQKQKYTKYLNNSLIQNELTEEKNIIKSFLYGNVCNIFIYENGKYTNFMKYNSPINYKKNSFKKKWITNIIENRFLLVLNIENDKLSQVTKNEDDETDNQTVILNILSNLDSKMYASILYIKDNPTDKDYYKISDINHNFICNNPINIENNKNSLDPRLNEYIELVKSKMKDYIDRHC
jgi:hypothetical protein